MATYLGTNGHDRITGSVYSDKMYGGAGEDSLIGSYGNDTLYGGSGRDDLYGGSGTDYLLGGSGSDLLAGGSGTDSFIFHTRPPGDGVAEMDLVLDFTSADHVVLDNAAFPSLGEQGWLPSYMYKVVGSGGVVDSNDRVIYNNRTGVLTYDFNGSASGGRIVLADFYNTPALTAADIYIG